MGLTRYLVSVYFAKYYETGSTYGESWRVDVVRTSPSLAVSGGED